MDDFLQNLQDHEYELSPLDIIPNHLYISNVFFFENLEPSERSNEFMPEDVLKTALYDSLQKFPILAGRLRRNGLNTMHIVVDPASPNAPVWESSEVDVHFSHLKKKEMHRDFWPIGVNVTDPLAHADMSGSPKLIRVRVCRFSENSGVALVVRISHSVFDAKGCTYFINHWAACCRKRLSLKSEGAGIFDDPILDRGVMYRHLPPSVRPAPLSWLLWPISLLLTAILSFVAWVSGKQTATGAAKSHMFCIQRDTLNGLRRVESGGRLSDHDIITALFTMGYAQTKQTQVTEPSSFKKAIGLKARSPKVSAIVPCDLRHRLGVPESYTGSCAIGLYVTAPTDMLLCPIGSGSLAKVAAISRKTVDEVDLKVIEQFAARAMKAIKLLGDKARVLYALMVCQAFTNQSRLPWYNVDFGFGVPSLVVPVAYSKSVAVIVSPPPPSKDVYVFLTLEVKDMAVLLQNEGFTTVAKIIY